MSYQLNDQIVLGLSINAPFGLTTDGNVFVGRLVFGRESKIATYNFAPTVAYRVAPGVIVGAGLQIEYIDAQLRSAVRGSFGTDCGGKRRPTRLLDLRRVSL